MSATQAAWSEVYVLSLSYRMLLLSFVALLCFGCDVYDETLLEPAARSAIPARPDGGSEGESIEPLTIALRDPVLDQAQDLWRTIGFDLDGLDTATEESDVECLPESGDPEKEADAPLDGDNGIDNAIGGELLPLVGFSDAVKNLPSDARMFHERGEGTLVMFITDYNGERRDPRVSVLIAQAVAGTSLSSSEVDFVDGELLERASGEPAALPAWNGADHWYVRDDAFEAADFTRPKIFDQNAYVNDGKLVLHLRESADILFFAGEATVTVRLSQGVAVATLNEDLSGMGRIDIGGRMSLEDVVATAGSAGVCEGSARDIFEAALVQMADVLAEPSTSGGRSAICDAVSVGVMFEAGVSGVGVPVLVESPPTPNPCESLGAGGSGGAGGVGGAGGGGSGGVGGAGGGI